MNKTLNEILLDSSAAKYKVVEPCDIKSLLVIVLCIFLQDKGYLKIELKREKEISVENFLFKF